MTMLDEETRRDIVEAKEAIERAEARLRSAMHGAAGVHTARALKVLNRILERHQKRRL
jgi:hypothetical protein